MSQQRFCQMSPVERWSYVAMRVRCALHPNEPKVIEQVFAMGIWLHDKGEFSAWDVARRTAVLLIDTAQDEGLPWHWRRLCLDQSPRPLAVMHQICQMDSVLPHEASEYRRCLQCLSRRAARIDMGRGYHAPP